MKKITLFLVTMSFIFFGCGESDTTTSESDTTAVKSDTVKKIERVKLTVIPAIIEQSSKEVKTEFDAYLEAFNSEITSFEQLMKVYELRDSLINDLENIFYTKYYEEEEKQNDNFYEEWQIVENELQSVGFAGDYAEGMFQTLVISPILEAELNEFAPEDYNLYMQFENAYAASKGSEYPYINIDGYLKTILIGEKLLLNHKNSKYYELIKEKFNNSISCVLDIHKVQFSNDEKNYYNSQMTTEFYPFVGTCEGWTDFIKNNPTSIFTPIMKNLLDNMSLIKVKKEGASFKAFIVVTKKFINYEEANEQILKYIESGIDIVHNLRIITENDKEVFYTCYRFYTNKGKAKEAYKKISEKIKDAEIYKVEGDGYEIRIIKKL